MTIFRKSQGASKLFSLGHAVLEVLEDLVLQLVLIALPGRPFQENQTK